MRQCRCSRDTWIAEVRDPGKTDPDRVVLDHAADHGVDDDGQRQDVVEAAGFQQAVADGWPAGVDRPRPHRRDKVAQQPYPVPPVQGVQVNGRLALQARVARGPKALGEVRRLRPAVVVIGGRVYDRRVRRLWHGQHSDERRVQPFRRRDAVQREHRGPRRVCPEHFARRSTIEWPVGIMYLICPSVPIARTLSLKKKKKRWAITSRDNVNVVLFDERESTHVVELITCLKRKRSY